MKPDRCRRAKAVYGSLLLLSLLWLGLIFAAPWSMAEDHHLVSMILYRALSTVCHQLPERSFYFQGFPLGVCSRCTGIYLGFVAGLLLYPFRRSVENERFPDRRWLIVSAIPMTIDFAGGFTGLFSNTFLSRTATGSLFGLVAAFYILPGFVSIFRSRAVASYI
jgi:uncharacterized membrane protein